MKLAVFTMLFPNLQVHRETHTNLVARIEAKVKKVQNLVGWAGFLLGSRSLDTPF